MPHPTSVQQTEFKRFETQSYGDAYIVIDRDGRPVSEPLDFKGAKAQARSLNRSATSRITLIHALGADNEPRRNVRRGRR